MPRKKKKTSGKKSLEFLESPYNKIRNFPSPVFCSDHPTTAKVVNCDECSVQWVSPQFCQRPQTRQRRKVEKRFKNDTISSGLRNNSANITPTSRTRKKVNCKMKPLRFLGDLTSSVMANLTKSNALVDEVSNDTDAHNQSNVDTESHKTGHNPLRRKCKPPRLKLSDILSSDSDISLLRDITHQQNSDNDNVSETSPFTRATTVRKRGVAPRTVCTIERPEQTVLDKHVETEVMSCDGLNLKLSSASLSSSPTLQQSSSSHTNTSSHCENPKGLNEGAINFSRKNRRTENCVNNGIIANNKKATGDINVTPKRKLLRNNCEISESNSPKLGNTLNTSTILQTSSVSNASLHELQRYGSIMTSDHKRRSLRLLLFSNMSSPLRRKTREKEISDMKVLAYDTPEEDYGLSFKQRRIKHLKRKLLRNRTMQTVTT